MKIALFHLGFYYSGGGEKLILEEMRGLRSLGHTVDTFAPYVDRESCFPDAPEISEVRTLLPDPPRWLPMKDPIWVALSCLLIPLMAWRFRSFEVFLGANQPGPWLAFVLSRILGKPYVVYLAQALRVLHPRAVDLENGIRIREGDTRFIQAMTKTFGWLIGWADRVSVREACAVLTNGEHVRTWIQDIYGVDSRVCAAGCHPAAERNLNYEQRWNGNVEVIGNPIRKPYILLTNRHAPMKKFEYALWALKSILREYHSTSLVITGQQTEYTDQLRYLAKGLKISDRVHFVGLVSDRELSELYGNAAVYVYPSPEEDFGMGIIEAMAQGTPVVAWRNGGPTVTVIDKVTGFLIEPYNTEAFAEGLFALLQNPSLAERFGRAGHKRATALFSYDAHHEILERALGDALQQSYAIFEAEEGIVPAVTRHWD